MKKKFVLFVFLMCCLFFLNLNNLTFADPIPDNQIKEIIENEFKDKYVDSLNVIKSNHGLSDEESFNDATLSKGIPYYRLSDDDSNSFEFVGYIFSIELKEKDVGTIFSENYTGHWKIFQIGSMNNIKNSFISVESSVQQDEKVKLINDIRYGVNALYIEGKEERIIDLSKQDSNNKLSVNLDNSISKKEFDDKIKELKKSRELLPQTDEFGAIKTGSSGVDLSVTSNKTNSTYIYLLIAAVLCILPAILILKKKK